MSERSLSPSDYYELKHVKSITYKHTSNVKKGRTILYQSTDKFESDLNKCNLSCDCSECGQLVGFSLKLHRELPLKETRNQKKKKTLRRFKAVGNAIIFILTYKMEAIKRLKKKMHLLRAVRNLTVRRPAVVQSVHLLPVQQPIKQPQSRDEEFEETVSIHPFQPTQKGPRKSKISIYMEKMLKDVLPKKEIGLKPLSILNDALSKNKKKRHIKCNSQLSLTQFNCQSQIKPFGELNKTQATNFYQSNNKDILKLIDIMKVKHRVIRVKK
ncbi:unnamed protein product [Paramecium pentaurelia]|uniref:Uncharacterized protein n=1 Tax=Paramecium pentaurelia TaxID=43138 RepID=A0A8S1X6X6_9CILI|nr:unnamed protein product [Paramecium pentaurelia]